MGWCKDLRSLQDNSSLQGTDRPVSLSLRVYSNTQVHMAGSQKPETEYTIIASPHIIPARKAQKGIIY